jgi:oligopeptide transport system ATP-binding protein
MGIKCENEKIESGSILYHAREGEEIKTYDLLTLKKRQLVKQINGRKIAMVFQDPMTALNPTITIGKQVMEGMIKHNKISKGEASKKAVELLRQVGIVNPENCEKQYPHQLSGGMRQRVVIAIALACNPEILICDEPTTALDVTIQAKILELIQREQQERNLSVLYITHDLGVVAKVADEVAVMYAGKIVEKGTARDVFYDPRHPYTWGLLSSIPNLKSTEKRLSAIPGTPPCLLNEVKGDAFAPRNRYALNIDFEEEPPMFKISDTHFAATWLLHPNAPKCEMPQDLRARIAAMLADSAAKKGAWVRKGEYV